MLDDVDQVALSGGALVFALAVLFRWPLSQTGLVVFAGLFGGVVVGLRVGPYQSSLYQGGFAGAAGAVGYALVLAALGATQGLTGLFPALVEATGMAGLLLFGAVAGAVVGERIAGSEQETEDVVDDSGVTLRAGRTSDAERDEEREVEKT